MANVVTSDSTKMFQMKQWLGLNESPDGDTGLKPGEAAEMRNFRITRENHLQIRPGYACICSLTEQSPVRGLWSGYVDGALHLLAACGGHLWDVDIDSGQAEDLGEIGDTDVSFFGFSQKVYLLTGQEYYSWSGSGQVEIVEGYIPIVTTATPPAGGGTLLERVNCLNGKRRAVYSPDGEAAVFQLAETEIDEVIDVEGVDIAWSADTQAGTVTFASAPEKGVNTITITWRKGTGTREKVTAMRWFEFYNGGADTRVFLYGDGTNETIYSDLDENGQPTAEYFPDLNVMAVDSANTPITGLIRHFNQMMVYKSDSAYIAQYDSTTLDTGAVTAAFYCTPVNREIGCIAPGQVRLVQNFPRTLFGRSVYSWELSYYLSYTRDERSVKRISDRVESTLAGFDLAACITFDDERNQEYYVVCGDKALVNNYGNDTWYYYENFPARCLACVDSELYFGTEDGQLMHFSRQYHHDNLQPIDAYWESGSMDFDRDWMRKYSSELRVAIKPESQGRVTVTAQSNRRSNYHQKTVAVGLSSFAHVHFAHWSFRTNRKPQVVRVRMHVKKFTFYKLILSSCSTSATATVLEIDVALRYASNVR